MAKTPILGARTPSAPQVDPQQPLPKAAAQDTATFDSTSDVAERRGGPGEDFAVPGADPSNVEKIKVKTTGDFNLQDPFTGQFIDAASEGTEVVKTTFIEDRLELKQLEIV